MNDQHASSRKMCRHCLRRCANRPRGLCHVHYYDPAVRDLYQVDRHYYRPPAAYLEAVGDVPPPLEPTAAHVGSLEKLQALAVRVAAGTELFHPEDSRSLPPDPEPGRYWLRGRHGHREEG